jgi:periplasmic protein TonB
MRIPLILGILCAFLLHAGFVLFGGLVFGGGKKDVARLAEVELLSDDAPKVEKEQEKPDEPKPEELEADDEAPPDAAEIIRNMDMPDAALKPELVDASLSAIEAALNGQAGSGDFAQSMDFSSGGVIGGKGKAGSAEGDMDSAFSLAEIDQKPRAIFQAAPLFPSAMRGKKMEGVVTVVFVVDAAGKVQSPRVEKSSHAAFEKPALDAIKKWKFEPAVKGGQRVNCKMRVPVRFQPS